MKTAENLIVTLNKIANKELKLELTLLFIEEIGGTLTHLRNVGSSWGAAEEETRVVTEILRYTNIIKDLKKIVKEIANEAN